MTGAPLAFCATELRLSVIFASGNPMRPIGARPMSSGKTVWPLIEKLSHDLDGDRESSERHLDELEKDLREISREARDNMRRQMIQIVAALSRLEVRMIDAHGPLD